jgi:hypothetical protein
MIATLSSVGLAEFKDRECPGSREQGLPVPGSRDPFVPYGPPLLARRPGPRQDGGLIVITLDEGGDPAACCGEASASALAPRTCRCPARTGRRPHRRGPAVPLIRPGTVSTVNYNRYSLLHAVEDIFGLPHLATRPCQSDRSARTYPASSPDRYGQAWQAPAAPVHRAAVGVSKTVATRRLVRPWVACLPCRCYGWGPVAALCGQQCPAGCCQRGHERLEQVLECGSAVGLAGHESTVDGGERESRQITSDGAILVRPDRFIAWRCPAGSGEPQAALAAALSQIARPVGTSTASAA